jgi:hypothetical protein
MALLLLVVAACLHSLADVLPRLVVPTVVLAAVAVAVRLAFSYTRRW